ncbi:BTAD domain-containing putative transcriptional regulator, partial [Conexibacter sp. CPCC 205762]
MLTEVALCGEVRASPLLAPLPNGLATQLFAYLVLHRRRPLQHAALADALWTNARPRNPRAVVSSLLSRLRRSLGPDVLPTGAAVRLVLPAGAIVDVDAAAEALAAARAALDRGDAEEALRGAEQAREIAGRGLLVDFDARWIDPWRTDVEATHLDALELIARASAQLGGERARDGERAARHAIARAPLRESAHAALMETLAALDEGGAALQVYEQLRARLDAELGAVPSAAVRELHQRLLGSGALTVAAAPAGLAPDASLAPGAHPSAAAPAGTAPHHADGADSAATPTVAELLAAVGPQAAAVAERVAVLGEVASVELLIALDGDDRAGTLARLQQCYDAGLLAPASSWLGPSATLANAHDEAALLATMPATAPAQLAAAALAQLRDDDGDPVAIARLALRAVPAVARDEAIALARAGVERLLRGRAFGQAAELAERALEVGPGRRDRVALLLDHGRALRHTEPDSAWRAAASAFSAARELDDPLLLARAALATGAAGAGERATAADGGLARRLREALDRLPARADAAPADAAPADAAPADAAPAD